MPVYVGYMIHTFSHDIWCSRFGTQGNECAFVMLIFDLNDNNKKERLNAALKHYIVKQLLPRIAKRELYSSIDCWAYIIPNIDVEKKHDFYFDKPESYQNT